jgi:hypothetical protein
VHLLEAGEPALVALGVAVEEAARLQEQPGERTGTAPVQMEERERTEAGADADERAGSLELPGRSRRPAAVAREVDLAAVAVQQDRVAPADQAPGAVLGAVRDDEPWRNSLQNEGLSRPAVLDGALRRPRSRP